MSFPAKLKSLRKRLGLSQTEAADLLGLSRQAVAYYEQGRREPPDEPIRSKAQILADLERAAKRDAA